MPLIDYLCTNIECNYAESHFHPLAEYPYPEVIPCEHCKGRSERNYMSGSPSTGFMVPMVVHYDRSTGQYSIPGHANDPVDRGYEKVEIRDMRAYAKLVKSVDSTELEKARYLQQAEREVFDARLKEQREERKNQIEKAISAGGYWAEWVDERGVSRREWRPVTGRARALSAAAIKYADSSIAARRRRVSSNGPNFHSRLLEHNQSEQSVVTGAGKKATFFFKK